MAEAVDVTGTVAAGVEIAADVAEEAAVGTLLAGDFPRAFLDS